MVESKDLQNREASAQVGDPREHQAGHTAGAADPAMTPGQAREREPKGAERVKAEIAKMKGKQPTDEERMEEARQLTAAGRTCRDCFDAGKKAALEALEKGVDPSAVYALEPTDEHQRHDLVAFRMGRNQVIEKAAPDARPGVAA